MTAKIVMPSAKRLIDVRQPCLSNSRIAEISVPAWPMPIHHTKLMIAKPQPTGMLTPQMPVPLISSQVTARPRPPISIIPIETTMNQARGVRPVRTTPPILSVIELNVCPGSISGAGAYAAGFGLIMAGLGSGSWRDLRVGVANLGQVGRSRPRVQIFEQPVIALELLHLRDARFRIVEIAEDDRVGRAGRGAGGDHFTVLDAAVLALGVDARVVDALDAVGALLHHAAAADGHVRVAQRLEARRLPVLVEQEVEAPHLVGAVVRAVARADAAVVDHVVQAFRAMRRRADRADQLARRVLALHAGDRLVIRLDRGGVLRVTLEVVVDADPVHLAAAIHLLLADDRDVVLGLARDGAGAAAGAGRQIDRHAPLVAVVFPLRNQGQRAG